jgi:regulator of replication initiation timing
LQQAERYIDLNMGIFELSQGNAEAAPRTASATMQIEDFGARRVKSKLRDIEGSLKRLGMVIHNLAKSHYTFQKTFRVVQPNNDLDEYTINRVYEDKTNEITSIKNDVSVGQYDIKVVGNSTLPSNRWGEWAVYMEAYQQGLIDRTEALKKTEIFDKRGVMQRLDEVAKLQQQLQGAQAQIKELSGDLQTARRETVHTKQQIEVEKAKTRIADAEMRSKSASKDALGKLSNEVKLQTEKIRINERVKSKEKS